MFHQLTPVGQWPYEQAVSATRCDESIVRTESETLNTVLLIDMWREFCLNLALLKIPNFDNSVLPTRSKQSITYAGRTPLNLVNSAIELFEDKTRFWMIWFPKTDTVLRWATSENLSTWVPPYLLYFVLMTTHPHLLRRGRRINIPVINLLALSSDCETFMILPIDLKTMELRVKLEMI